MMKGNIIFKMKSFLKMRLFNFHDAFPLFFSTNNLGLFHVTKRKKKFHCKFFLGSTAFAALYSSLIYLDEKDYTSTKLLLNKAATKQ